MSVIHRDYLDEFDRQRKPASFPRELAAAIARKAETMARRFEEQALDELTRAATRALRRGVAPDEIARQMEL